MNFFSFIIVIAYVSFLLVGCTNPNNHNNFNITVGAKESKDETYKELMRYCSPRKKCPNLWRFIDKSSQSSD